MLLDTRGNSFKINLPNLLRKAPGFNHGDVSGNFDLLDNNAMRRMEEHAIEVK